MVKSYIIILSYVNVLRGISIRRGVHMEKIIAMSNGTFFAGWDFEGGFKFVPERRLAYRMRAPLATKTLGKLTQAGYVGCFVDNL